MYGFSRLGGVFGPGVVGVVVLGFGVGQLLQPLSLLGFGAIVGVVAIVGSVY